MEKIDYEKQGKDFLEKHGVTMAVKFLFNGPFWDNEKESRDVYKITLERKGKEPYTFRFGQSIDDSGLTKKRHPYGRSVYDNEMIRRKGGRVVPTAYAVLTCLQKSDVGTFENFCSDFGYDTDSRKAEKTYFAVQAEYSALRKLFSQTELDEMNEIQ